LVHVPSTKYQVPSTKSIIIIINFMSKQIKNKTQNRNRLHHCDQCNKDKRSDNLCNHLKGLKSNNIGPFSLEKIFALNRG
jgi:hypothetical protein